MKALSGFVALVTGASRGVGKGIALGLGEAGATVIVTGRSESAGTLPGTIGDTAREVTARGGEGHAIRCDHADDEDVDRLFVRVARDFGRIDVLVNNVFAIPPGPLAKPFWELPLATWDAMHRVGLRSHYAASAHAARIMLAQPPRARAGDAPGANGLVVNVSSWGGTHYAIDVAYGVGKAALDRMSRDCARELAPHGIAMVSLVPGIVKTERVVADVDGLAWNLADAETPLFSGRAVAALAADPRVMERSGKVLVVAELAREYGFVDEDGRCPPSLRRKK